MSDNLKIIAANFRQQLIVDCIKSDTRDDAILQWINSLSEDQLLTLLINNADTENAVEYAMYQLHDDVQYRQEF